MKSNFGEELYIPEHTLTKPQRLLRAYFKHVGPLAPRVSSSLFWKLFTTPKKRKLTPEDTSFLASGKQFDLVCDEYAVAYKAYVYGDGSENILICHGWEGMAADFKLMVRHLQQNNFRVTVLDFPGHGKNSKTTTHLPIFIATLHDYINKSNHDYYGIIGHSLGAAAIAMALPKLDAALTKKIVLLGLHPKPSEFIFQFKKIAHINDELFDRCVRLAQKKTKIALIEYDCFPLAKAFDKYEVLFIHDTNDRVISVNRVREFTKIIPKATVFEGTHGGHYRHYKNEEVINQIAAVLRN